MVWGICAEPFVWSHPEICPTVHRIFTVLHMSTFERSSSAKWHLSCARITSNGEIAILPRRLFTRFPEVHPPSVSGAFIYYAL